MIVNNLNSIIFALGDIGAFLYALSFLVSFLESLAFIGTFVPGGIFLAVCGFLSSQGNFSPWLLVVFASLGAILGDILSFYIGRKGTRFFKRENKILRLGHLQKGQSFFKKYGSKSVFFGRFVGPLRPIIPFVAGLSGMEVGMFMLWNIFSAILWAIAYVFLGYFFGGALKGVEVWSTRVTALIFFIVIFAGLVWIILKRGRMFLIFLRSVVLGFLNKALQSGMAEKLERNYPEPFRFIRARLDTRNFTGFPLTVLALLVLFCAVFLSGLIKDVLYSEGLVFVDIRIGNLLYFFRSPELSRVFLYITSLGSLVFVITALISFIFILFVWRKKLFAFSLFVSVAGTEVFVYLQKVLIMRPRPSGFIPLFTEHSFSFPSGHSAIAVAFYGFLAYFFIRHIKKWKNKLYVLFGAVLVIFAIGFSRMYLGVHYLSDVLGGYLTGLIWLIVAISFSEFMLLKIPEWRQELSRKTQSYAKTITIFVILFVSIFYFYYTFTSLPKINGSFGAEENIKLNHPLQIFGSLPKTSEGLFGSVQEPISFIIVAPNDTALLNAFMEAGWDIADEASFETLYRTFQAVLTDSQYDSAPLTPAFWNNNVNDFGIAKTTAKNSVRERHHARIWKTDIKMEDGQNIYVATASFDVGIKWGITHRISPDIDAERENLSKDLLNSGTVLGSSKISLVSPVSGENFTGDPFYTDGQAYLVYIK